MVPHAASRSSGLHAALELPGHRAGHYAMFGCCSSLLIRNEAFMSLDVHFNPDAMHILAATRSTVALFAHWHEMDEIEDNVAGEGSCVVNVSRALYFASMAGWLDEKATLYSNYGEFCGVGCIHLDNLRLMPHGTVLSASLVEAGPADLYSDFWSKTIRVREYTGISITEYFVNMEHG
jgi:hypothetical protein